MDAAVEVPDDAMSRLADRPVRRPPRRLLWPIVPLAFAGWWVIGALPWVVTGLAGSPLLPRLRPSGHRPPATRHAPSRSAPPSVLHPDHAAAGPGALEPATRHTDDAAAR